MSSVLMRTGKALALLAGLWASACSGSQIMLKDQRPVRFVVPFPAGGPTDGLARVLAQRLSESLGRQVVVDNRAGANGIVGQEIVAKAPADGHTVLLQSVAFAINPALYRLPYDSERDFIPVSMIATTSLLMVVHPSIPATSVRELIDLAKSQSFTYASFGNGSIAHLAMEMLNTTAGIKMTHVAYKGVPQALVDLLAGRVQLMMPGISSALPHVEAGKLRALAVTSPDRSTLAPTIPTMQESGVHGYQADSWFGMFLPAGADKDLVDGLSREVSELVRRAETRSLFRAQGFDVIGNKPTEFKATIRAEMKKYARLVRSAGIKVE